MFDCFLFQAIYDETTPDYKPHLKSGALLIDDIEIDIGRNAVPDSEQLWPKGVVPYIIDKVYPDVVKDRIHQAMREIENDVNTPGSPDCIKFKHRSDEKHYVYILARESSCHSKIGVGGQGRYQEVSIGRGCERKGVIMHELTHCLGFGTNTTDQIETAMSRSTGQTFGQGKSITFG